MPASVETSPEHLLLAEFRASGADQLDPVRFRYLEALAQRLAAKGLQNTRHWQKLVQAISEFQAKGELANQAAQPDEPRQSSPLAALLAVLNQAPEVPTTDSRSALEQLVFGTAAEGSVAAHHPATTGTLQPLKAMARVQADHGAQALQDRIRHAIEQTPKDAGPMNAHRLVSRAMAELQRLSPEYLNRFANYTDTLMALERLGRKG